MVNVSKHTIRGPYGCDIGWFNRDPYIIVYEIPTYTWVENVIPKLNPKQPGALLFLAQMISLGGTFEQKAPSTKLSASKIRGTSFLGAASNNSSFLMEGDCFNRSLHVYT